MENEYDLNSDSDNFGKISRINSAGLVNSTLSNLWNDFFGHFKKGQYLSANNDLDCIWTILGGENGIEGKTIENNYKLIELKLSKSGSLQDSIKQIGFNLIDEKQVEKFQNQKKILIEKSLFLRRLMNSQGKGTAYDEDDEEAE